MRRKNQKGQVRDTLNETFINDGKGPFPLKCVYVAQSAWALNPQRASHGEMVPPSLFLCPHFRSR
jgi:hypothetical protein